MSNHNTQDIALRDVFLKLGDHVRHQFRSWKLIAFCGFLLAFLMLGLNFSNPRQYKAELNFMLNDEEGSALGGLNAILGQFGLGGGDSDSNLDKIIELSRARRITSDALFSREVIGQKNDLLANHLISVMERNKKWADKGLLSFMQEDTLDLTGFRFSHDSVAAFNILENKALKRLHTIMMGKEKEGGTFQSEFSELSSIMNFSMTSPDPQLSIKIVNQLFDKLSEYYTTKSGTKQEKDFLLIKEKYDSIQNALDVKMYAIAQFEDQNRGLVRKKDAYLLKKMKADEYKLGMMLGEVEKQYQIAQLSMETKSEYIQVIDRPLLPLKPVNKGKIYYFLLGGLLGGMIGVIYTFLKKVYSDTMRV